MTNKFFEMMHLQKQMYEMVGASDSAQSVQEAIDYLSDFRTIEQITEAIDKKTKRTDFPHWPKGYKDAVRILREIYRMEQGE